MARTHELYKSLGIEVKVIDSELETLVLLRKRIGHQVEQLQGTTACREPFDFRAPNFEISDGLGSHPRIVVLSKRAYPFLFHFPK